MQLCEYRVRPGILGVQIFMSSVPSQWGGKGALEITLQHLAPKAALAGCIQH